MFNNIAGKKVTKCITKIARKKGKIVTKCLTKQPERK